MISITKRRERLLTKSKKLSNDLLELQELCPHAKVAKVAKADTGNWCKNDDLYWYELSCPECGKFWTEPQ
jgi:hypothetical protein